MLMIRIYIFANFFKHLFREISENLNKLIEELDEKEYNNPIKDRVFVIKETNNLKESLVKFQTKLRNHFRAENLGKKNHNEKIQVKSKKIIHESDLKDTLTTTSSDTLIDADSSFESISFSALVNQKKFYTNDENKKPSVNSNEFIFNHNPKYYQQPMNFIYDGNNNEDDEDDYDDRILLTMDDLSITTIQTTALEETESAIELNRCDEEFQTGLETLDQKIFHVKKLLQSMKTS